MKTFSEGMNRFYIGFGVLAVVILFVFYFFAKSLLFSSEERTQADVVAGEQEQQVSDPLITVVPDEYLNSGIPDIASTDPKIGLANAPVKLFIFSDYQCAFCKDAEELLQKVVLEYPNQVQIIWKDAPNIAAHSQAKKAAEAARCAGIQEKFWEYHDGLFAQQDALSDEIYSGIAESVGLDAAKFENCLAQNATEPLVQKSLLETQGLGVTGTPAFYVNEKAIAGLPSYEELKGVIDSELPR